jgi:hypothetical protein
MKALLILMAFLAFILPAGAGGTKLQPQSLTALLQANKDHHSASTEQAIDTFLPKCTLGFHVVKTSIHEPGTHIVGKGDHVELGNTRGPKGERMLLAYADPELWLAKQANLPIAGIPAIQAMNMVKNDKNVDGIWINVLPDFSYLLHKQRILKILHDVASSQQRHHTD